MGNSPAPASMQHNLRFVWLQGGEACRGVSWLPGLAAAGVVARWGGGVCRLCPVNCCPLPCGHKSTVKCYLRLLHIPYSYRGYVPPLPPSALQLPPPASNPHSSLCLLLFGIKLCPLQHWLRLASRFLGLPTFPARRHGTSRASFGFSLHFFTVTPGAGLGLVSWLGRGTFGVLITQKCKSFR